MAHKDPKHYQDNRRSFPSDDINPELKKNKEFFLAYAEAIWSMYVCNECAWPFTNVEGEHSIDELRALATGRQSMQPIKENLLKRVDPNDPNSGYKTKMKISWSGYKLMPKILDILRSFNSKIDYEVEATAIDDDSVGLKETDREYMKYYLNADVKKFMEVTGFKPKMKVNPDDVGAVTEADVDLLMDAGGFNLEHEIGVQVVSNKTKKLSRFAVVQDLCFDDIITHGRGCMYPYVNKDDEAAEVRWVDPKYAIVPNSKFLDFHDVNWDAEVRFMDIKDFRKETDLTESQLQDLARDYCFMNPKYEALVNSGGYYDPNGARAEYMEKFGIDPMNDVKVMVLDFEFLSLNIENFLNSKRDTNSVPQFKKVSYEYEVSEHDAKRGDNIEKKQCVVMYEGKWIVGSDYFINYGPAEFVKYKGPKGNRVPTLRRRFVQINNSSIVDRCWDIMEDINTALFKRRAAINSLPPAPRMIIEQGLLDNVMFGDKLQTAEDLITAFEEKGVLIVNRVDEFNKPISPNGKPIEFVPSGIIEDITLFTNEILNGKEAIKDVTGVNDITAAESPEARTGYGVSKLSEIASSNALFPSFNAWKYLFEPTFEIVTDLWQMIIDDNETTIAHVPLGSNTMQTFKLGKEFANARFSTRISMVIGEQEKQNLLKEITELKEARRQNGGKGGITGSQYLKLYDLIMSGNRKLAQFILAQIERLQSDRDMKVTQDNQKQTFDAQAKVANDAEVGKQKTYQVEGGVKSNTALITEAAKRKTALVQALVMPVPEGQTVDKTMIQEQIEKTDEEIANLLKIIHQSSDQVQAGPPPPGGQPPQQLQQAS